jgi:hypothetical protein
MIDKIDGVKFLRKTADIIENCDKDNCGKCLLYDKCRILVERTVDFVVLMREDTKIIFIP